MNRSEPTSVSVTAIHRQTPTSHAGALPITRNSISVVVPAFNEEEGLEEFHRRISAVLNQINLTAEIVYVNDGSSDRTLPIIQGLQQFDPRVTLVDLSRNFGKETALTAGLDYAKGDAVVVIDADLQDPPELIPEMISHWQNGCDVVYARRFRREGETWLKKLTAAGFYRIMHRLGSVAVPQDTGDFRLLSRRAVDAICRMRETHRFMKGLFAWIGYRQKEIIYARDARHAGATKWNYWRLWNFALEGITSFTVAPLKIATYMGTAIAIGAFSYGGFIIGKTIFLGRDMPGYASIMAVVLFLGGIQLLALGVLGEYIGRMFNEVKQRPLYLVQSYVPAKEIEVLENVHTT